MNSPQNEEQVELLPSGVKSSRASKQPHTQRKQQIFLALDEAASEGVTTYIALINSVRIKTGKGCSPNLVAEWKKERAAERAKECSFVPELKVADQFGDQKIGAGLNNTDNLSAPTDNSNKLVPSPSEQLPTSDLSRISFGAVRLKVKVLSKLVAGAAIGLGAVLIGGASLLNADQPVQLELIAQSIPAFSQSDRARSQQRGSNGSPNTLKLDLTVSSPKDLKVREGDTVVAGEVLADRVEERERAQAQLQALELEYKQLATKTILVAPPRVQVPAVKALPPISYEEEEAQIAAAEVAVRQAERAFQLQQQSLKTPPIEESAVVERVGVEVANRQRLVNNQKRKIDAVARLENLPDAVMPHEQEVLKQKDAELQQAEADYRQAQAKLNAASQAQTEKLFSLGVALEKAGTDQRIAIAKLQTKKDARAYTEYEASVTAAQRAEQRDFAITSHLRQQQEIEQQQRDRSYQLAQIKAKIAAVKQQLSLVSVVTSPYTGTVKVIKVQKQTNNSLSVEITLAVSGSTGVPNSGSDRHPRKRDAPSPIS